ncbi:MAG: hypothetical protein CSB23_04845 [Deltaproteobacteria bacterium]|nr:MAG: hypothetical protein CSB23_04845 [Deltaproteobacteria bacterium]
MVAVDVPDNRRGAGFSPCCENDCDDVEQEMTKILFVTAAAEDFTAFRQGLPTDWDCSAGVAADPSEAFTIVERGDVDVVVVGAKLAGSTGLDFAKELMSRHPFINCALMSSLSKEDFHEATEGYGIFMQVSENPAPEEARRMADLYSMITGLLADGSENDDDH